MIVGNCNVGGLFAVESTVAFSLVGIATGVAIKQIAVVHPDMIVILLQAYVITLLTVTVHQPDIADLYVRGIFDPYTPAICNGIVADTFHCNASSCVIMVFNDNITIKHIIQVRDLSHQTDDQRTIIFTFFKAVQNRLQASARITVCAGNIK